MTNIQTRLIERYKGYKQKDLYEPKKIIIKLIKDNTDDFLRIEFAVDIYEMKRYYSELN